MDQYILKMSLCLALIVGLLYLTRWFAKKYGLQGLRTGGQAPLIRVVSKQAVGPRANVVVIDLDGDRLILGVTPSSVNLLATKSPPHASNSNDAPARKVTHVPITRFDDILNRARGKWATPNDISNDGK